MALTTGKTPAASTWHPPLQASAPSLRVGRALVGLTGGASAVLMSADRLQLGRGARPAGFVLVTLSAGQVAKAAFPGQSDKVRHAMVSAALTGTVSLLTGHRGLGIAAGIAVGVAKECIDGSRLNPKGHRDFSLKGDLGADAIGILMGAAI